ncbi:MAG: galactose mutarotase, partial [Verrucomicrobiae bacterium]|nr:galactose mutarotase [Verrucomicrobiae bacterium]
TFAEYEAGHPLFGSVVGRYANRISGGGFSIDGVRHDLKTVNPKTGVHIHGGKEGLASQLWEVKAYRLKPTAVAEFTHVSPAGHEGFPGRVEFKVIYRWTAGRILEIEYRATADQPTHVNLTNHAYFNLGGMASGDIRNHVLTLQSDRILEFDDRKIPTGGFLDVTGTPFDFRRPRTIGSRLAQVAGGGYDHCYVLTQPGQVADPTLFARLEDPKSGRVMEVLTTQPGVQLYTANYLKPPFLPHQGVCLETQHFPDSPNRPEFPSTLIRPGEEYREVTVFRFSVAP